MGNPQKRKRREREVRKKLARQRHFRPAQEAVLPASPPGQPDRFVVTYGNANDLAGIGPVLKAAWSVPDALAEHLVRLGRAVPSPVVGLMLIDTGASKTCMALDAAQDLQLTSVGYGKTYGAGGLHRNQIFEAVLTISIADTLGGVTTVRHQGQIMGIPELGEQLKALGITVPDGSTSRLIGLLGRDVLRYATMTYHGTRGIIELAFDLSQLPRSAFVAGAEQTTQ